VTLNPRSMRLLLLALALLAAGFGWLGYRTAGYASRGPRLELLGQVPPFSLTERSGRVVTRSELEGQIWIANFIFTRCLGPCPVITSKMMKLQTDLADVPDVRLVSFSVDPVADTPEVLTTYAQKYKADPQRWLFLTGDVQALYELVEKGFRLPVGPQPPPGKVVEGDLITHTSRFVLVDRQGRLRGYFNSDDADFHERMLEGVSALKRESG